MEKKKGLERNTARSPLPTQYFIREPHQENIHREQAFPLWINLIKSAKPMTIAGPQSFICSRQIQKALKTKSLFFVFFSKLIW